MDATAAANHHHQSKSTEEARLQQVRQLLWAQSLHGAAEAPPVVPGALQNLNPATETNAPVTRNAPRSSASETQGNATSDNPNSKVATTSASKFFDPPKIIREKTNHRKNNLDGICRVNLTVNWKARTRSRSDMQPPSVKIVTVDVYPGEICARFISRMVQMPPGGAYNDTQLSWGSFVLQPTQVMEEYYNGSWVLNLRSEPPPELVLVLPVGSLLVHPALCNAAGWRFCVLLRPMPPAAAGGAEELEHKRDGDGDGSVKGINNSSEKDTAMKPPMKRSKQDDLLIDGWVPTKKALKAAAAAGITAGSFPSSSTLHQCSGSEDKELKVLSNRALHPGRTDPKRMAEVLREYRVIVENEPCSIVDVGSGDGYFVNGLIKAFPQVGAVKDLVDA